MPPQVDLQRFPAECVDLLRDVRNDDLLPLVKLLFPMLRHRTVRHCLRAVFVHEQQRATRGCALPATEQQLITGALRTVVSRRKRTRGGPRALAPLLRLGAPVAHAVSFLPQHDRHLVEAVSRAFRRHARAPSAVGEVRLRSVDHFRREVERRGGVPPWLPMKDTERLEVGARGPRPEDWHGVALARLNPQVGRGLRLRHLTLPGVRIEAAEDLAEFALLGGSTETLTVTGLMECVVVRGLELAARVEQEGVGLPKLRWLCAPAAPFYSVTEHIWGPALAALVRHGSKKHGVGLHCPLVSGSVGDCLQSRGLRLRELRTAGLTRYKLDSFNGVLAGGGTLRLSRFEYTRSEHCPVARALEAAARTRAAEVHVGVPPGQRRAWAPVQRHVHTPRDSPGGVLHLHVETFLAGVTIRTTLWESMRVLLDMFVAVVVHWPSRARGNPLTLPVFLRGHENTSAVLRVSRQ